MNQRGFTLVEVLVALVIFSIGLLGLAGLQSQSIRYTHSAYLRTQATFLAYDILDRMRVNMTQAKNSTYDMSMSYVPPSASCVGVGAACSPLDLRNADRYEWKQSLAALPNGKGSIQTVTAGGQTKWVIDIQWDDPNTPGGKSTLQMSAQL
ncbi:MAG: type IV pilus modification protein PilV [Gammaproteobacteria bacterium]|nr:type IV pilus modification protein PilV [Gammaproteobacteria bacterium]